MTVEVELLQLRAGVDAATAESGETHLLRWPHAGALGTLSPSQWTALRHLSSQQCTREGLRRQAGASAEELGELVDRLRDGGWLRVTVTEDETPLYTVEPLRAARPRDADYRLAHAALSRFAALAPDGHHLVLAAPEGACDVRLHDPRVLAVVSGLAGGAEVPALARHSGGLTERTVRRLLADLEFAGVLDREDDAEPDDLRLRQWSPHELWFHAHSRQGDRRTLGADMGATLRFAGAVAPLPARRNPVGSPLPLDRPDLGTLRMTDPPLTAVLEDRASQREHDPENPITLRALSEFLYRCTGIRERVAPGGQEYLGRPYPAGGALYELEFYPLVQRVDGLSPGLYRYDQNGHHLECVDAAPEVLRRMVQVFQASSEKSEPPQVVVVVSARFGRVMWKYEAMAYALTLKHVGVIYQVMYLVATAMGLAGCALGAGTATDLSEAIGADPLAESAVGEFMLGAKPSSAGRDANG
ncbi:SagB/ThcOx family dehydrogenase [Streptomonospora wellingtoniae]|uniref:SagB family peptide dehydrogenase n=1 Tax=Streptomonospora wellingtoniae TaxID=3075544 RepID=A0ABU2KWB1_9ACTN|nr:SagB family peptide dehydrogenase [Streptomonospora sp. DSM 45055]MDT0303589.1 SagB family peptide dehydrogenase [Streptomonospora sp. DSM 45055]